MTGKTPVRGDLGIKAQALTNHQVNVVCGVTGVIQGQVVFGMSVIAADKIASISCGHSVHAFNESAALAIAKFCKDICERSVSLLAEQGYNVIISPPTIVKGNNVKLGSSPAPALVVPLGIDEVGDIRSA